jgi:hypothetical protein
MSEYQYYEFQAIDRPLTGEEMGELRSCSSRARITPTSFVNDYAWGSFKGDENAWMERYFDAFLYLANWGTRVFKLRLPSRLLPLEIAQEYRAGGSASVWEAGGKAILSFFSEDEEGGGWVEGEGYLSSLISVRAELARGDLRALYLGWLLGAQSGEVDEEEVEPPIPVGLGQLSGALRSLTGFLRIDEDLLHVAAEASAPLTQSQFTRDEVRAWVARLPPGEKDELLASLLLDTDPALVPEFLQRFLKERNCSGARAAALPARRTADGLLRAAEVHAEERQRIEAKKRVDAEQRRQRQAAVARAKDLDGLAGREPQLWAEVGSLIAEKKAKSYEQAVRLLLDLRDLDGRKERGEFRLRLGALREAHAGKPALLRRLGEAGL